MSDQHLLSEYVFIDSEAYFRCRFDFSNGHLGKLAELAKAGMVSILITEITRREVCRHIEKRVQEVFEATRRDRHILQQAGVVLDALPNFEVAMKNSLSAFTEFLSVARAVTVPLSADLSLLVDDYFSFNPPFSEKKQNEFPDAIVASSLRKWCVEAGVSAYIVSGDKDFDGVCETCPQFHKVDAVADVLTHASVSEELHRTLAERLRESDKLAELLEEELVGRRAETSGASRHYMPGPVSAEGRVAKARIDGITTINVVDSRRPRYTCAIEFEANLRLQLDVTDLRYEEGDFYTLNGHEIIENFSAEVSVIYAGDLLEIESVSVDEDMINLDREIDHL